DLDAVPGAEHGRLVLRSGGDLDVALDRHRPLDAHMPYEARHGGAVRDGCLLAIDPELHVPPTLLRTGRKSPGAGPECPGGLRRAGGRGGAAACGRGRDQVWPGAGAATGATGRRGWLSRTGPALATTPLGGRPAPGATRAPPGAGGGDRRPHEAAAGGAA